MTAINFKGSFVYFIFLIFSFFIVFASLLLPQTFNSGAEMKSIECGWPIPFTINDQSRNDPPFPWETTCFGNPLEDIHKMLWLQLFIDLAITFSLFLLVSHVFQIIRQNLGEK